MSDPWCSSRRETPKAEKNCPASLPFSRNFAKRKFVVGVLARSPILVRAIGLGNGSTARNRFLLRQKVAVAYWLAALPMVEISASPIPARAKLGSARPVANARRRSCSTSDALSRRSNRWNSTPPQRMQQARRPFEGTDISIPHEHSMTGIVLTSMRIALISCVCGGNRVPRFAVTLNGSCTPRQIVVQRIDTKRGEALRA